MGQDSRAKGEWIARTEQAALAWWKTENRDARTLSFLI
jgi:hypothetical protein